jgi:hypothetical protein
MVRDGRKILTANLYQISVKESNCDVLFYLARSLAAEIVISSLSLEENRLFYLFIYYSVVHKVHRIKGKTK